MLESTQGQAGVKARKSKVGKKLYSANNQKVQNQAYARTIHRVIDTYESKNQTYRRPRAFYLPHAEARIGGLHEQYNSVISEHNDMFEKRPKIGSKQEQWRKERRKSNNIIRIVKVVR